MQMSQGGKREVSGHVTGDFGLIGCVVSLETVWMHCFSWFKFVVQKMSVVHWLSGYHMKNSLSPSSTVSKNFCGLHLPLAVTFSSSALRHVAYLSTVPLGSTG